MYTVEFSNNSRMYVKKWVNEEETVLTGSKSEASVPLSLASQFHRHSDHSGGEQ